MTLVFSIETSCDETSVAIVENGGQILSQITFNQAEHNRFGGVVPEIASRAHLQILQKIIPLCFNKANLNIKNIDLFCATCGPGLVGGLLVGSTIAKTMAIGINKPFYPINHLEGHLVSPLFNNELKFPNLILLLTGGHTQIWLVSKPGDYTLHATTVDDAAGEAFDKGARILGLGYPGGPEIEQASKKGDPFSYRFTIPKIKNHPLYFSFSGLKTALLYKCRELTIEEVEACKPNLAASYQETILNSLFIRLNQVVELTGIKQVYAAGGVAANMRFRAMASALKNDSEIEMYFPSSVSLRWKS